MHKYKGIDNIVTYGKEMCVCIVILRSEFLINHHMHSYSICNVCTISQEVDGSGKDLSHIYVVALDTIMRRQFILIITAVSFYFI